VILPDFVKVSQSISLDAFPWKAMDSDESEISLWPQYIKMASQVSTFAKH